MNRRDFVVWSSLAGVAAIQQRGPKVRIVMAAPPGALPRASEMGIRMGVEEAERAALMFGGSVTLAPVAGDARAATTVAALEATIRRSPTTALLGGVDAVECSALSRLASRLGVLYFNVSSSDDALRGDECHRTTFHVLPSTTMFRDAKLRADPSGEADARSMAWDESLVRFGADTLNQRFETRYGRAMTDEAWAGWLAVKIVWEGALRARTSDPGEIGKTLTSASTRFDGHKGWPLSFRPWDHQLRQPVYVLLRSAGASRTIEVPSTSNPGASSTLALDELGISSERTTCRWQR